MSDTDPLQAAREHLATTLPAGDLPPSVAVRELAETRRLLTQLVNAVGEMRPVMAMALADGLAYRADGVAGACGDCDGCSSGTCPDCAEDRDRASAYRVLAAALGIEIPRG